MKKPIRAAVLPLVVAAIALLALSCDSTKKKTDRPSGEGSLNGEITVSQLGKGYADGTLTVTEVVKGYLKRIEEIDKSGPALNSIIVVNPDALHIAAELDRELKAGKVRGPMHGIPVILKDNIDTGDKMATTAGATVLRNSHAAADSHLAKKLREAGAVILGKANLSEWANFRGNRSTSGWSGVGGQTRNPYVLDRNPCGSSSGSGVAVSAGLCAVAIGTETNGSIVCPANNNGIVGLKPTVGLISRSGIIPISWTQDTPGPMGRTVEDVAVCLGALTGVDPLDEKTKASEGNSKKDYTPYLKPDGLRGKRIGLVKDAMGFHNGVDRLMAETVDYLKRSGAEVVEVVSPTGSRYESDSYKVMLYEFKDGLNSYFASLGAGAPVQDIAGLIRFNEQDTIELRYFDQEILKQAEAMGGLSEPGYREALARMQKATREEGIDRMMNENRLDALMAPTGAPAWKTDLLNGDHYMGGSSSLAAISGYPAIAVPMGFIGELPVDVTFFGRAWSEPLLLEIAYGYEQGHKARRAPRFLVTD
jgi:amidase